MLSSEQLSPSSPQPCFLVTGATGLLGKAICQGLKSQGFSIRRLTRHPKAAGDFFWQPESGELEEKALDGLSGVIHLAGEPIADGRWTASRKAKILSSRVQGTALLAKKLVQRTPAGAFVAASGIGVYPLGTPEIPTETAPAGTHFLARVVQDWEGAADPLRGAGWRVAHLRLGVVLSRDGGALAKMLPVFRMGLGGPAGNGQQRMSWISLEDAARLFVTALHDERFSGPLNAVAPAVVTNAVFAQTLAALLKRPALLPTPAFALRLAFGEMADETILADNPAEPARLRELGYHWQHPQLEAALRSALAIPS